MAEGTVAADQLRLFIERIERLEEEKKGIADDIRDVERQRGLGRDQRGCDLGAGAAALDARPGHHRDVYAEAKANGYDTKTMRAVVRLRKMETHARQEADALLETYRQALGLA
jgi:uncharacterized protein (UPF0335 family)